MGGCLLLRGQGTPTPLGQKPSLVAPQRREPLKLPLSKPHIVVQKSKRQLLLYASGQIVRTYPIALGLCPIPNKVHEGDRCTPEGLFYITQKNAHSKFHRSLGLSYPNAAAAERGLRDGLITKRQYHQIKKALKEGRSPPQDTPLGSYILIHGGGSQQDWTWGCVALDDRDIRELFKVIPIGAKVKIEH